MKSCDLKMGLWHELKNVCLKSLFSSRHACWGCFAHPAHWPVQRQPETCHVLYCHGRNKLVFWNCCRSCELHLPGETWCDVGNNALVLNALQVTWVTLCFQAFNLTSDITDSLDNMLTDSLKSRMPAAGFQLIGVRQIEEDNMTAC